MTDPMILGELIRARRALRAILSAFTSLIAATLRGTDATPKSRVSASVRMSDSVYCWGQPRREKR
jgi:hypothetical protein